MVQRTNHALSLKSRNTFVHCRRIFRFALLVALAVPLVQAQQPQPQSNSEQSTTKPHPMTKSDMAALNHDLEIVQSRQLLQLATDLEAELKKTSENTLSLDVIRRANQIEHLARNLKERSKVDLASN